MRKVSIIFEIVALALVAVLPAAAQADRQPVITLERTACFGACPVYAVSIYADGTVAYNGERFVEVEGAQTGSIDPAAVDQLIAAFEAAGYFDWNDEYTEMHISDAPTITTSVMRDGVTKQITRYAGDDSAPIALAYLENWIDEVASTQQWTGKQPALTNASGNAVISLQRTQCFGTCPVYALNLYEDGTVIYLGVKYVAVTGVQVSQIDPGAVTMLAQIMTATGYFDWQSEYTDITITDQPSVITSLSTPEQYKQIIRYAGDANAPVGLTWIEDRIDSTVNSDQWVKRAK